MNIAYHHEIKVLFFPFNQSLGRRPRRNRRSPVLRAAFQETTLSPANLVYPLFIHEGQ
jgi:delta-aminolevulinic acid dehydratase/porphobilinogen synthase